MNNAPCLWCVRRFWEVGLHTCMLTWEKHETKPPVDVLMEIIPWALFFHLQKKKTKKNMWMLQRNACKHNTRNVHIINRKPQTRVDFSRSCPVRAGVSTAEWIAPRHCQHQSNVLKRDGKLRRNQWGRRIAQRRQTIDCTANGAVVSALWGGIT